MTRPPVSKEPQLWAVDLSAGRLSADPESLVEEVQHPVDGASASAVGQLRVARPLPSNSTAMNPSPS